MIQKDVEEINLQHYKNNSVYHGKNWSYEFWLDVSYKDINSFFKVGKTINRKKYTCKYCREKIYDDEQLYTEENYSPSYHMKCYMQLYNIFAPLFIIALNDVRKIVDGKPND